MNCNIIKDLLPLYCDGVCSSETAKEIEEHIKTCSDCDNTLETLRHEPEISELIRTDVQKEVKVLKGVKRKFSLRRRISVLCVVIAALVACGILTAASDIENPIAYHDGTVTANQASDEAIDIYFDGKNYASFKIFFRETEEGNTIYFCCTQTIKSSVIPFDDEKGHIVIGNGLMTDFVTACYQVPRPQEINAVYYLEASEQDYIKFPQMNNDDFDKAAENAVALWSRANN